MSLLRDSIDLFAGWQFDGTPEQFSKSIGCGCLIALFVLGLVAGGAFWLGRNW